jgi:hypothetical protein
MTEIWTSLIRKFVAKNLGNVQQKIKDMLNNAFKKRVFCQKWNISDSLGDGGGK